MSDMQRENPERHSLEDQILTQTTDVLKIPPIIEAMSDVYISDP